MRAHRLYARGVERRIDSEEIVFGLVLALQIIDIFFLQKDLTRGDSLFILLYGRRFYGRERGNRPKKKLDNDNAFNYN